MLNAKTSLRNCQVMLASAGSVSFPIVISLYFSSCIFCSGSCMRWVQETSVFSAFMFFVNSSSYAVKVRSWRQFHDFLQRYLLFPEILSVCLLRLHLLNFGHNMQYRSIYTYLYIGVDRSDLWFLIVTLYGMLSRTSCVTKRCSYAHKSYI